jgi:hypothetical protein
MTDSPRHRRCWCAPWCGVAPGVARERPSEDRIAPGRKIDNQPATVKDRDRCVDLPEIVEVVLERLGDRVDSRLDTAADLHAKEAYCGPSIHLQPLAQWTRSERPPARDALPPRSCICG